MCHISLYRIFKHAGYSIWLYPSQVLGKNSDDDDLQIYTLCLCLEAWFWLWKVPWIWDCVIGFVLDTGCASSFLWFWKSRLIFIPLVSREWKNGSNCSYKCVPFLHSLLTKGRFFGELIVGVEGWVCHCLLKKAPLALNPPWPTSLAVPPRYEKGGSR